MKKIKTIIIAILLSFMILPANILQATKTCAKKETKKKALFAKIAAAPKGLLKKIWEFLFGNKKTDEGHAPGKKAAKKYKKKTTYYSDSSDTDSSDSESETSSSSSSESEYYSDTDSKTETETDNYSSSESSSTSESTDSSSGTESHSSETYSSTSSTSSSNDTTKKEKKVVSRKTQNTNRFEERNKDNSLKETLFNNLKETHEDMDSQIKKSKNRTKKLGNLLEILKSKEKDTNIHLSKEEADEMVKTAQQTITLLKKLGERNRESKIFKNITEKTRQNALNIIEKIYDDRKENNEELNTIIFETQKNTRKRAVSF